MKKPSVKFISTFLGALLMLTFAVNGQEYLDNPSYQVDDNGCLVQDDIMIGHSASYTAIPLETGFTIEPGKYYSLFLWADASRLTDAAGDSISIFVSSMGNSIAGGTIMVPVKDSGAVLVPQQQTYSFKAGTINDTLTISYSSANAAFDVAFKLYYLLQESDETGLQQKDAGGTVPLFHPNLALELLVLSDNHNIAGIEIVKSDGTSAGKIENPEHNISIADLKAGSYMVIAKTCSGRKVVSKLLIAD